MLSTLQIEASVRYGSAVALNSVSFSLPPGTFTAIVGPNGAGKSSLLGAIYGSVRSASVVRLGSVDLSGKLPIDRARAGIALVPQGRQIFPHLSVTENLEIMARLLFQGRVDVASVYAHFPILKERGRQLAGNLSGGEQQMLVIARALLQKPRVLLLDEIGSGLAPRVVASMLSVARAIADAGGVVIAAEPSTALLRGAIDHGYVLIRGEIVGTADSWSNLDQLYRRSLGIGSTSD